MGSRVRGGHTIGVVQETENIDKKSKDVVIQLNIEIVECGLGY